MELAFHKETVKYLSESIYDQIYQEQTAEMTIPEAMPDIGRIVDCFGTVTVQSKEVETGCLRVTGGIQAGVLYLPEGEETSLKKIEAYLPFTVSKKIQSEDTSTLFYWGWIRSIDARFINGRKVLIRANLGSELTLLTPAVLELPEMDECPKYLACKSSTYLMRLPMCSAEKELQIADEVLMPDQEIGADQLLKWTCMTEITDSRVIGDKAVFKGNLLLRVLYQNEEGELGTWSGSVPFSQYAELDPVPEDATPVLQPIFRHAEVETDGQLDSHRLLINITVTVQILVMGTISIRLQEDAYSLRGSFSPEWENVTLNPCLDLETKTFTAAVPIPADAERVLDWTAFPDRPSLVDPMNRDTLDTELSVNLLYYDADRALKGTLIRQKLPTTLMRTEQAECDCFLNMGGDAQVQSRELRIPMQVSCLTRKETTYQTLSAGKIEETDQKNQPSLIVRFAKGSLWDVAKQNASSVEAIRLVNQLETEDLTEERMLLIPVGEAALSAKKEEA